MVFGGKVLIDSNRFFAFNISNKIQIIPLIDINLIGTDQWIDLITGNKIEDLQQQITLKPYESLWLSNVK